MEIWARVLAFEREKKRKRNASSGWVLSVKTFLLDYATQIRKILMEPKAFVGNQPTSDKEVNINYCLSTYFFFLVAITLCFDPIDFNHFSIYRLALRSFTFEFVCTFDVRWPISRVMTENSECRLRLSTIFGRVAVGDDSLAFSLRYHEPKKKRRDISVCVTLSTYP